METAELIKLINTLTKLTQETEWVEFKHNFHSPEEMDQRIIPVGTPQRIILHNREQDDL